VIATLRGTLTRRAPVRVYRQTVTAMTVTAVLQFTGRQELTLSIRDQTGKLLAQTTGRSPLKLSRRLPSGTFAFTVKGRKPSSTFELTLSGKAAG
jgi:hypothetical protein